MPSQHENNKRQPGSIAGVWIDPQSVEEAEERLIETKGAIASVEAQLSARKGEVGDTGNARDLPEDYVEWRTRTRRALHRFRRERTNLILWIQRHKAPNQQTAAISGCCISCNFPLPQDRSTMYSEGWTRVRGAVTIGKAEQLYEAYQCPSCSEGVTADVRAFMTRDDHADLSGSIRRTNHI